MKRVDRTMSMAFLHFCCNEYNINSEGTSWEYFRQFKQLYGSVNGRYIDINDSNEVKKVRVSLHVASILCF